ncbi:tetratricopeptide repeat protein [Foetidibacter luteolus]|uniref:tetratricopeptide repeat protein n=1 Tax=Foetidibacter luteolus TaxID=2608880 RepID=UPI001A984537|nr:tetratricopeptide repeat protein [Foetidibacter luteolus]
MKKLFSALLFLLVASFAFTQEQDPEKLHATARTFMQQGDYDNALLVLNRALELKPGNPDISKDIAYVSFLRRDYAKAIEVSNSLINSGEADVQCYQVLGLTYKAIAQYKEADEMYKKALKLFSGAGSGVLYSEYGELLLSQKNPAAAIKQWEKGIEADANYSGNYYYAAKYYAENSNLLWALLYGENFINIESLSARTVEIKDLLFNNYQKLFATPDVLPAIAKKGNSFEKAVASTLAKFSGTVSEGVTPESLTALRTRFILDWYSKNAAALTFRLFDHQRQFLQEGLFDAYNQWVFGSSASSAAFRIWVNTHDEEMKAFQTFQRSIVFKIPSGQYYMH